mgnify:CR=1 FL=1
MFGGWCEKPAGRCNDLIEIKVKVEAPSLTLSLQVLNKPSSLLSSDVNTTIVAADAPAAREKHAAVAFSSSHPSHSIGSARRALKQSP